MRLIIADTVLLYRLDDPAMLSPAGHVAVQALRLDPRRVRGVDADDAIWLVTVDGRQPALSLGMTFKELQALSHRLGLRSALNLDGGGSTTMVARGFIVNHPSDDTGPRKVRDAILVFARKP